MKRSPLLLQVLVPPPVYGRVFISLSRGKIKHFQSRCGQELMPGGQRLLPVMPGGATAGDVAADLGVLLALKPMGALGEGECVLSHYS